LRANQKDQQSHSSPKQTLVELDLNKCFFLKKKKVFLEEETKREKTSTTIRQRTMTKNYRKRKRKKKICTGFSGLLISGTTAIKGRNSSKTRTREEIVRPESNLNS
jgi:sugar diacid utilization regulator